METTISLRIDENEKERLQEIAKERQISLSTLIRSVLVSYLLSGCVTSQSLGNGQYVLNYHGNQYSTGSAASSITYREASKICLNFDVVSSDSSFDSRGHQVTTIIRCK